MTKFYKFYLYFQYLCVALWVFVGSVLLAAKIFFFEANLWVAIPGNFKEFIEYSVLFAKFWLCFLIPVLFIYLGIKEAKKILNGEKLDKRGKIIIIISPLFAITVLILITILLFGNIL